MRIIAFANCDKALKKGLKALLIFEVDLKEANIASDISVNVGIPSIAPTSVVRVSSVKALVVPALIVGALAVALILIKGVVIPTTVVATIVLVVGANGGAVVRTDGITGIGCIAGVNSTDGVSVSADGSIA